jgi:hypothetical protein
MIRRTITLVLVLVALMMAGCGETADVPASPTPAGGAPSPSPSPTISNTNDGEQTGTLQFRANGEDFIRQGFLTKDGWAITFDHVYVTLDEMTAYQADPPYDAEAGGPIQATTTVRLDRPYTVDLAAGDENAPPILVAERTAPPGRYNALSWEMVRAQEGPASGAVIVLEGTASKDEDGQTIVFRIALDNETAHTCGDYVGDERKGIVEAGGTADVEATFHFDHLFGDAETPMDDNLNTGALGFAPLAALATDGTLNVDTATLQARLSPDEYAKVEHLHLAHVGEGHCTGEGH